MGSRISYTLGSPLTGTNSIRRADVFLRRPGARSGPFLWRDWPEMYAASKIDPVTDYIGLDGRTKSVLEG